MAPKKTENQSLGSVAPSSVPEPSAPSSVGTPESSNTQDEGVYVCLFVQFLCFSYTIHGDLPHESPCFRFENTFSRMKSFVHHMH